MKLHPAAPEAGSASATRLDLDCVVLCGGAGTRLREVVSDRPKSMALVGGRPFLELLILALRKTGVTRFVLATGYLGDQVEAHFGDGSRLGVEITYSREHWPLGTAGAVRSALHATSSSPILVVNGDTYCCFDPQALLRAHRGTSAAITLQLAQVFDGTRFGTVVHRSDGVVLSCSPHGPQGPGWVSAGVALFERGVVARIPADRFSSLELEVVPRYVGSGLRAVRVPGPFLDIGTPEDYRRAWHVVTSIQRAVDGRASDRAMTREHLRRAAQAQELTAHECLDSIVTAAAVIADAFADRHKLLLCGNGGSAADCQHVAAEFVSRLHRESERPGLPALALTTDTSFLTGYSNDCGYEGVFERQVAALGEPGDVLLAISTSGGSGNVLRAVRAARRRGISTVGLCGREGRLKHEVSVAVELPCVETQTVQECMLAVEHVICELVESSLFGPRRRAPRGESHG